MPKGNYGAYSPKQKKLAAVSKPYKEITRSDLAIIRKKPKTKTKP
jgi:hypothetical protein